MEEDFESVLDIAVRFDSKYVIEEFFTFVCEYCIRFSKNNKDGYYPFIYNHKQESILFSFNFFVGALAKFYLPGNKEVEAMINYLLRLDSFAAMSQKERLNAHRDRIFVFISLFQEYFSIIYPNNKRIPSTRYKSSFIPKVTYFIPIVYEDKKGNPIQYEIVPSKVERLLEIGVPGELIRLMVELSNSKGLKEVAFNAKNCQDYWKNSNYSTILKFE